MSLFEEHERWFQEYCDLLVKERIDAAMVTLTPTLIRKQEPCGECAEEPE